MKTAGRVIAAEPPLPEPNARGNRPAIETMQALLARDVLRDRFRLGLTQAALARLAAVRVETVCRIETGKHTPTISTISRQFVCFIGELS
ncbi:MAG: helix-turn-helix domain-containing protein [Proteobacteria bacterium]|nr:helix-turn-helix domain-containing protein [Pseudomonadota bacterium]